MSASTRDLIELIERLTLALGPPVATPERVTSEDRRLEPARYRVWLWRCPACHGGWDDPDLIWRPFTVASDGRLWCSAPHCQSDHLAATVRALLRAAA